jgi:hypothetical protein
MTPSRRSLGSHARTLAVAVALPAACAPPAAAPDDAPLTPPFAVSDHFSPTGYMGDGTTIGVVNMLANACPSRAPGAVGDCYQVTYVPPNPTANGWAGVYWQYPGNNWGGYPGHTVEPGATHAAVYAMGANGGEQVTFKVGGIAVGDATQAYHDSLSVSAAPVTLTTQWQPFSVDFKGATYDQVLGGFAWIVNLPAPGSGPPSTQPIVFYLDGITWSP